MKRILLFLALLCAQPAFADTWTVGEQSKVLSPTGTNVIGDGSDAQGGLAPALTGGSAPVELADIPDNFTTAPYFTTGVSRKTLAGGGSESKFRTICNFGSVGHFDIIVSPGTANFGHLHMFFGNDSITKDSDYTSLRTTGESSCGGNKLNRSAYWAPAFMEDLGSGVAAVRKFDTAVVYYQIGNLTTDPTKATRIPRGFTYIGGYDPADPNNTKLTGPINTANAANGSPRYSINGGIGTSSGTGFAGWACLASDYATVVNGSNANSPVAGSQFQPYLQNPNGTTTLTCPTNGGIEAVLFMPKCWDGHNLHSGGSGALPSSSGRLHVSYTAHDNNTGQDVCFTGWYVLPEFEVKYIWSLKGSEDVGKFYLSSDVMNYGAPDPTSRSPCRQVSSHYCHGETMHNDWFGAWSYGTAASPGVMIRWMNHCDGIKIVMSGTTLAGDPAECDSSTIDGTNGLITGGTTATGEGIADPTIHYFNAIPTIKYGLETGQTGTFIMNHPMR